MWSVRTEARDCQSTGGQVYDPPFTTGPKTSRNFAVLVPLKNLICRMRLCAVCVAPAVLRTPGTPPVCKAISYGRAADSERYHSSFAFGCVLAL